MLHTKYFRGGKRGSWLLTEAKQTAHKSTYVAESCDNNKPSPFANMVIFTNTTNKELTSEPNGVEQQQAPSW